MKARASQTVSIRSPRPPRPPRPPSCPSCPRPRPRRSPRHPAAACACGPRAAPCWPADTPSPAPCGSAGRRAGAGRAAAHRAGIVSRASSAATGDGPGGAEGRTWALAVMSSLAWLVMPSSTSVWSFSQGSSRPGPSGKAARWFTNPADAGGQGTDGARTWKQDPRRHALQDSPQGLAGAQGSGGTADGLLYQQLQCL